MEKYIRVFILGGTGAIGTAVLQELIARSYTVVALSRSKILGAQIENWARLHAEVTFANPLVGALQRSLRGGCSRGRHCQKFVKSYGNTHETTVLYVVDLIHKHSSWAKGPTIKD